MSEETCNLCGVVLSKDGDCTNSKECLIGAFDSL